MTDKKLKFWNERAALSDTAGSNDFIGKDFEMDAILKHIKDGMNILDIGCGSGTAAFEFASKFDIDITGFDFSPQMIDQANKDMKEKGFDSSKMRFFVEDIKGILDSENIKDKKFDLIITERVIINLDSWDEQEKAIKDIMNFVTDDGAYLMCENLQEGLDNLNKLRSQLKLETINQPWHNRYLKNEEINNIEDILIEDVVDFSSTYYFFSRIINAAISQQNNTQPSYDSPINQLSFQIKDYVDLSALNIGQSRLWVFKKKL
jgi:ubiquinone/menaquinone biosynthesis C-methylase UbiE